MPVPIAANLPSATPSNLALNLAGQQVAAARGAAGLRFGAGTNSYGELAGPVTDPIYQACKRAAEFNFGFVELIFGYGPQPKKTVADKYNGGVLWQTRNRPPSTTWDWIGDTLWTDLFEAAYQGATDGGKSAADFLRPAWFNEPGYGGVGGPHIGNLSDAQRFMKLYESNRLSNPPLAQSYLDQAYEAAYQSLITGAPTAYAGTIEQGFFQMLLHIVTRVNWRGCDCIVLTLEGSGTSEAQREVDSITGDDAEDLFGLPEAVYCNSNRYADPIGTPYVAATAKAAYSSKLQAQVTRMNANALISGKQFAFSEGGAEAKRCPRCTPPNTVRSDLNAQAKAESGIAYFCNFTLIKANTSTAGDGFNAYEYKDGNVTALDNVDLVF